MVRLAFVSDIHSNLHALTEVLRHAERARVDRVVCLGDIVGYNAHPNECVELLRKADAVAVMGNHDWAATDGEPEGFNPLAVQGVEHSRRALRPENRRWLATLPRMRTETWDSREVALAHGSPRDPLVEYVFPSADPRLRKELARVAGDPDVLAMGHTHIPMRLEAPESGGTLCLNPGSVGQPRDGDPRASYMVLDTDALETDFVRVKYDTLEAARAVRDAGLPEFLWRRLLDGV